jgi:crossover junction endodeoxyribonuclease RuvC
MEKSLILGIDPGSRSTGYGLITIQGHKIECVHYGEIHTNATLTNARLQKIDEELRALLSQYQPNEAAIEKIFTCHNHQSALKLGQARGVALVAVSSFNIPISEYGARQVKKAVVGYGAASKQQHMVTALLHLKQSPPADAADALAIALCHANSRRLTAAITGAKA